MQACCRDVGVIYVSGMNPWRSVRDERWGEYGEEWDDSSSSREGGRTEIGEKDLSMEKVIGKMRSTGMCVGGRWQACAVHKRQKEGCMQAGTAANR